MKSFSRFWKLVLVAVLSVIGARADAQVFGFSASASTAAVAISNSVTYTIALTNQSAVTLQNVSVTNLPSALVRLVSYSTTQGSIGTNAASFAFNLGTLSNGVSASMMLTVDPIVAGLLTNVISVTTTTLTNTASTNVVVQVFVPPADLGVAMAGFPSQPLVGDQITYGVSVTNFGPSAVSSFTLTNTLPPGAVLVAISPTNPVPAVAGTNLIFNFGAMPNGGSTNFQFTVQVTNAGVLTFSASVGAGLADTNAANNFASSNVTVQAFIGQLIATNVSTLGYSPQIGLMTNVIRLSNIGTNAVPSARVIVSGLTNRLYNAVGTNSGNPFVVYPNTLDTNQSVDLLMEYFIPTRRPIIISNSQYTAVGIPAVSFNAPPGTNGVFDITRIVGLSDGSMLIEFQSILGRNYTIQYSDNDITFSNAQAAQPSVTAPADRTQWIDSGPPKTASPPSSVPTRYYRVMLDP